MTHRHKLIALPKGASLDLTPKLWLALGLIAYNHYLMTLEPLQVLTPGDAGRPGLAAMLSTEGLAPVTRTAVTEIARALLAPLGLAISAHGGKRVPGVGHTPHYILVEDRNEAQRQEQIA
jgi:hypothetical protein